MCNTCCTPLYRLHNNQETTAPLMNQGFTLRLLSTNWNRFDVAAVDFGCAGRASEVLPAYNMAATPALKTITAAPGTFLWQSSLGEITQGTVEVADTVPDLIVTMKPGVFFRATECTQKLYFCHPASGRSGPELGPSIQRMLGLQAELFCPGVP